LETIKMEKAYQVIARRWRPKQFSELVGQDHIVRTLSNAIETKRIAHAYLFVGPRGTGKTSTARLFAKALNAEGGPSALPDNESETSRAIMDGSCMDVIEIDGASNNSVEQVRSLREECQFAPAQCTYKIYIIDEVHMLSTAAFNALLKTLEEPPEHVKFFFATTEAHKVLPTIVSRCQRFEFRPISDEVITEKLTEICQAETIQVEPPALASIARLANGGMRDAQSILDQMISFCGNDIKESDVLDVYGLVSEERIAQLAQAIAKLDFAEIIGAVDSFVSEGRDLYRILVDLQAHARKTLLVAIEKGGMTDQLGCEMTTESIMRMLDALHRGEAAVQRGLSEKVNFEVVLLKAAEESRSRAIDTLIKQVVAAGDAMGTEVEGAASAAPDVKKN
jgi:DNA polymerase-3 subunit gamma/tau